VAWYVSRNSNLERQVLVAKEGKLLVTGGSGLLGSHVIREALNSFIVFATCNRHRPQISDCDFIQLDIQDKGMVISLFRDIDPNMVIHTAALRSVDYCENHPDEAWAINVLGTENIALASKGVGAKLIHISSDSVFDGNKGMYTEKDIPNPITLYGKTKLEAEKRVQQIMPESIIARTCSIYGWSLYGQSLAEWILGELKQERPIKMFVDSFFSPILANNLAQALLEMYHKNFRGIYHVAGSERCSRFIFAHEIARAFELDGALVLPATLAESELSAPRPRDSSLNVTKAQKELVTPLLNVREGISWFKSLKDKNYE
jgi:dTDP-4-dehydrorhamnose reductase